MAKIKLLLSIIAFASSAAFAAPPSLTDWQYRVYKSVSEAERLPWKPAQELRLSREYQGFIEYRARIDLSVYSDKSKENELGVFLGRISDVDRTYVNDVLIGETGSFPPHYENNMDVVREYRIPREALGTSSVVTLRVLAYVEYPSSKGLNLSTVEIGFHRDLQQKKYVADLSWYGSRMFIPVLCLLLAAISLPWLAPVGLRFQQAVILLLGVTCFIFGICRSRVVFHFMDIVSAYKLTGMSSVLAVTLICWYAVLQAKIGRQRVRLATLLALSLPVLFFWPVFLSAESVLVVAGVMKRWFFVEAVMIWAAAVFVIWRAGSGRFWLKLGFLFLAAVITNDILRDLRVFNLPILMDIGFGVFLVTLVISQLVSLRMSWSALARREARLEHDVRLGRVSGLLSHDLRNKIGCVSVLVDSTALAPETKDKIASLLGRIKGSVELHLKQAVADPAPSSRQVEMSAPEAFEQPACSLGGVVQTCIEDLKMSHSVELIADIARKAFTAFVPIEYSEMSRCATNILLNAIEASSAASPTSKIYVSAHVSDTGCEIVVKDQGAGFSDEALRAALSGNQMTTKPGGTGLGVISARTILARIGGELKITTSAAGTVVRLILPRVAPPAWFFNIGNHVAKELIVLDDDTNIHEKVRRLFPEKTVFATTREDEFIKLAQEMPNALVLVDFDFGGTRSGLDLIASEPALRQGVLVSGRISFDRDLRGSALDRGVRMYPKECLG